MRLHAVRCRTLAVLAALGVVLVATQAAWAQLGSGATAGVAVNAEGVLQKQIVPDPGGQLMRERIAAARSELNPDLTRFSKLRKISLNRLEQVIADGNGVLTDEMRKLAGLLRVKYVFFYPETKDIVLAGPAEGWVTNPAGRVVGMTSNRPTLLLEDLIVALRAFPPSGDGTSLIGCSIDPTQEGLAAMQNFLRETGTTFIGAPNAAAAEQIATGLKSSLGRQNVRIEGIAGDTHFAQVMVEADYRMKLIGIGMERPSVHMVSFVDLANPAQVSRNALQRWYFVPDYECVRVSEDGLAAELVGDGVKLVGENEAVSESGIRRKASRGNRASQAFVTGFTKKYSALAESSPVFAQLRNLIDLAVAAAFIQDRDYYGKAGWKMPVFGNESRLPVQNYKAPEKVDSVVAAKFKGNRLMTPIGGGVRIEPALALDEQNTLSDEKGEVESLRQSLKPDLKKGQWWWD